MSCYAPITAYRPKFLDTAGKPRQDNRLVFDKRKAETGQPVPIPCGKCIGCRIDKRQELTLRAMHEKKMHKESCFVTLTYDEYNLPKNGSLELHEFQKFMKRLRENHTGPGLRFLASGEYGDQFLRPHYHLLLFNYDFKDKVPYSKDRNGNQLWMSADLLETWRKGHCIIGEVTTETCRYVAGYVIKKLTGPMKSLYGTREPEFSTRSLRPGLGSSYFDKYGSEALTWQSVVVNGKEVPPPRYYKEKWRKSAQLICTGKPRCKCFNCGTLKMQRIKSKRNPDNTKQRKRVKETIATRYLADKPKGAF